MEKWIYWIALQKINRIGDLAVNTLLSKLGSPENIFNASKQDITSIEGMGIKTWESINRFDKWKEAERDIEYMQRMGYRLLCINDDEYPENLLNIYNPPPVLYINGEIRPEDNTSVAVVGARLCNHYGIKATRRISGALADLGITVTSGMAMGIDAVSHSSCLQNGGRTIAVLGNGLDVVYPSENRELYSKIPARGAIVSEFPLGTSPDSGNFPKRNRIISGISIGVVVIQASRNSGSLITASLATQQNREVFAVPGNIDSGLSAGTNMLIRRGAKLVENVDDIIEEIEHFSNLKKPAGEKVIDRNPPAEQLNEKERLVYDLLKDRPHHVDEIAKKLNIDSSDILSLLLDLELRDFIEQTPGKYFQLS